MSTQKCITGLADYKTTRAVLLFLRHYGLLKIFRLSANAGSGVALKIPVAGHVLYFKYVEPLMELFQTLMPCF
jgi:hypothetical protein